MPLLKKSKLHSPDEPEGKQAKEKTTAGAVARHEITVLFFDQAAWLSSAEADLSTIP